MGLIRTALVFGAGYTLGRPDAREYLAQLGQRPQVKQLRERGWDRAGEAVAVGRRAVASRRSSRPNLAEEPLSPLGAEATTAPETAGPPSPGQQLS
jgi:hypothetical protein